MSERFTTFAEGAGEHSLELSSRFDIRRRLGTGGMGAVYEAYDHIRKEVVALKMMARMDPSALYRFKNEFRALADIHHDNLVKLHELLWSDQERVLVMEMVDGVDFFRWVRPHEDSFHAASTAPPITPSNDMPTQDTVELEPASKTLGDPPPIYSNLDIERLRGAITQLATGVSALHANNRIHLDIKPSNVLVDDTGRVAVCDFGLTRTIAPSLGETSSEHGVVGTVSYMSPEQAAGSNLTPASDWYSVGVVLYQALTERVPFIGDGRDVLTRKQTQLPKSAGVLNPSAPRDLIRLCDKLLSLRPEDRPSGEQVLCALGASGTAAELAASASIHALPFVSRESELDALDQAFAAARNGAPVLAMVTGAAGVGKSALIRSFTSIARHRDQAIVLTGRCHEHESVPYKAFDAIVDTLTEYLLSQPRERVELLVPADIGALSRLFPVLRRVRAIAAPPMASLATRDPKESRRRAFAALRELLANLADHRPVILAIDDMQWGDADSGRLLRELMREPNAPPLLILGTFRSDETTRGPLLELVERARTDGDMGDVREISVSALSREIARDVAAGLLGAGPVAKVLADSIARESQGNPFFLGELVRYVRGGETLSDRSTDGLLRLQDVLEHRIEQLSADERALLCAIAVAGQPVPIAVAARAAGLESHRDALAKLRVDHLARSVGDGAVEAYHHCVRQAVGEWLGAAVSVGWHRKLAEAHEVAGNSDPQILLHHWRESGDDLRAATYAERAADIAADTLAFDRAQQLYDVALKLGKPDHHHRSSLLARRGDALAHAGHGAEAADLYIQAVDGADAAQGLELRRRAAEQWLYTGHVDRGRDAIRDVLGSVGFELAKTPRRALMSLLWRRTLARTRGLGFRLRDRSQISPEQLTRVDILWSASTGLSMIDTIHGADFQTRHLHLALSTGEPRRVARALAMEAAYSATRGVRARRRTDSLLARAGQVALTIEDPYTTAFMSLIRGACAYLIGDWRGSYDNSTQAEQMFRDNCSGVAWELTNSSVYALSALPYIGDLDRLAQMMPQRMAEAEEHGNLYMINWLRSGAANMLWLAADDPDQAEAQARLAADLWTTDGFHVQHYFVLWAVCQAALYRGEGRRAWEQVSEAWPALRRSLLLQVRHIALQALYLRGRCAIAGAAETGDARLLRRAARDANRIAADGVAWTSAGAETLRAGIASVRGDVEAARAHLDAAQTAFQGSRMALYESTCRLLRAKLGGEHAEPEAPARAAVSGLAVASPEHMTRMLVPGFGQYLD